MKKGKEKSGGAGHGSRGKDFSLDFSPAKMLIQFSKQGGMQSPVRGVA